MTNGKFVTGKIVQGRILGNASDPIDDPTEGSIDIQDAKYLVKRLEQVISLINAGENHMAVAKLLADISALSTIQPKLGKLLKKPCSRD
jgi:hypothetical protein